MADMFTQPPLAPTVSAEARAALAPLLAMISQPRPEMTLAQQRAFADAMVGTVAAARAGRFAVSVTPGTLGGIPVQFASRSGRLDEHGPLLLNFHGGGFTVDAGSLLESVPIADLTGIDVAAVLYRLAPEHSNPAASMTRWPHIARRLRRAPRHRSRSSAPLREQCSASSFSPA